MLTTPTDKQSSPAQDLLTGVTLVGIGDCVLDVDVGRVGKGSDVVGMGTEIL